MFLFVALTSVWIASCNGADSIEDVVAPVGPGTCIHRNAYIKQDGQCDTYIECKNYIAVQMSCPDGLHYNPDIKWPNYPCQYPMDETCTGVTQAPNPTPDCPHQYGYFPSPTASSNDCGKFQLCMDGKAIAMKCPTGLAFNPATSRCDWADLVPTCNVEAFLGFKCPPVTYDDDGNAIVTSHKFPSSCDSFYSCQAGDDLPRLLSCDPGTAFNDFSGRCEDADKVSCNNDALTPP
ncbi:unnamed protein product [Colias eurytheme]|nr:unnamed protein product [Colias eurytheme]